MQLPIGRQKCTMKYSFDIAVTALHLNAVFKKP